MLSFNPHTHEGCDNQQIQPFRTKSVSIHTPTKGVTHSCSVIIFILRRFNPHTHEGCDAAYLAVIPSINCFNPHTHEGCDVLQNAEWAYNTVSIHTPTKGVTPFALPLQGVRLCFNPHTHEGCDKVFMSASSTIASFNPHTHEGCDTSSLETSFSASSFNPHTHEGCDISDLAAFSSGLCVSIHTPTKGVTCCDLTIFDNAMFQSTHPRRV